MADNLLRNPGFEDGAYPFDPLGIVYIPKEWKFTFREGDASADKLPRQTAPWGRPNAGCLSPQQFPPHEHPIFFQEGSNMLWKTWLGQSFPQYVTLTQSLTLTPGRRYRFTAKICPDMVKHYGPQGKIFLDDPDSHGARLVVTSGRQTFSTEFKKAAQLPNLTYTPITLEFTAPAAAVDVSVEAYGLFVLENNCFFMDNFALVEIEAPKPQFTAPANNLLINGSFEEGQAYPADDAKTLNVPAGWLIDVSAGAPTAALLSKRKATPADQGRLFAIGNYAWRIGSTSGAFAARLWQGLSGFAPGKTYRVSALVLPDFTGAPDLADANLIAQCGGQTFQTGAHASRGSTRAFGKFDKLEFTFQAPADRVEVSLALSTRTASSGAWVVDLVAVEEV